MNDFIDFIFSGFTSFWTIITSSWIVAFPVLFGVLCLILDLIKSSREG